MKFSWTLLCCVVLAAALTACKSGTPAATESDPEAEATAAADESAKPQTTPGAEPDIPAPPDVAAVPKDAEKSESGLAWKVLQEGEGDKRPDRYDIVTMNFTGWTPDGQMFLSSQKPGSKRRGTLLEFIPGWIEGVQLMLPGEKRRFWVPGKLAYGEVDRGEANRDNADVRPDQPRGVVVFDIELVEFKRGPRPPRETPEDVAEIPKNAKKSKSGLAWRVLQHGTGMERPTATSRVIVNYAAWTTDGKMFDTSLALGRPASFVLETSMPGLQEGVQMMVVGELRRLWIPENLAFADQPGRPKGMVVYDITLLDFKN
jgi:peptidylprolyl isomerase